MPLSPPSRLRRRRFVVGALVSATLIATTAWLGALLAHDGLSAPDVLMVALFALSVPGLVITFWSAVIGAVLLRSRTCAITGLEPAREGAPARAARRPRVAVVVPVCNEAPEQVYQHLQAVQASLDAAGEGEAYGFFVLSDTSDPVIAALEEELFARWRQGTSRPERLHYRRRSDNHGFKAGNVWDFCERHGAVFDFMLVLDADSVMSGAAISRLVRIMEANPRIGILQPLIVGLPALSPFARIFQFGMRHGMRAFATGSAWWQQDEGPYWGHNAIVRLAAFRRHCRLPQLPEGGALGGEILSHDQIEAVLMRRGGYEVRVLPLEDGSFEQNPPTLPDFLRRDLRWCHGNLQYLHLLRMPGIRPLGRLQLLLAIMMYLASPFWLGFLGLGLLQAVLAGEAAYRALDPLAALGLFALMLGMGFAPKLLGVLDVLLERGKAAAYGGRGALLAGTGLELLFSALLGPITALAHTIFIASLAFGHPVRWEAQVRAGRVIPWREAWRGLWPHTLLGLGVGALLWHFAPSLLFWSAPVLAGLVLAVPFARITSSPTLGRWLARAALCATPEELDAPAGLTGPGEAARRPRAAGPALRRRPDALVP